MAEFKLWLTYVCMQGIIYVVKVYIVVSLENGKIHLIQVLFNFFIGFAPLNPVRYLLLTFCEHYVNSFRDIWLFEESLVRFQAKGLSVHVFHLIVCFCKVLFEITLFKFDWGIKADFFTKCILVGFDLHVPWVQDLVFTGFSVLGCKTKIELQIARIKVP